MLQMLLSTLSNPRETAPEVLRLPLGERELILAAGLIAALSGLLDAVTRLFLPLPSSMAEATIASPIVMAIIQLVSIFVVAGLIHRVGRAFGGYGDYPAALKASVWVSALGLAFTVATLLLMAFSAPIAQLFQLATIVWMLMIFTIFIQTLHGFENFFSTLAGVLGTMFGLAIVVVVLLGMFGLMPEAA